MFFLKKRLPGGGYKIGKFCIFSPDGEKIKIVQHN